MCIFSDTKYGYDCSQHLKIYNKELTWTPGDAVVWGWILFDNDLIVIRSSFVVLRIGMALNGQASFPKPIIEGLIRNGPMFFVVLGEKRGLLWRSKNPNQKT